MPGLRGGRVPGLGWLGGVEGHGLHRRILLRCEGSNSTPFLPGMPRWTAWAGSDGYTKLKILFSLTLIFAVFLMYVSLNLWKMVAGSFSTQSSCGWDEGTATKYIFKSDINSIAEIDMRGVVVIPNGRNPYAVIDRNDCFIMVVEPLDGGRLDFLDVVEVGDIEAESRAKITNFTTEAVIEVIVRKVDVDITWEEKMALWGKETE
jgi:hypothetical protein